MRYVCIALKPSPDFEQFLNLLDFHIRHYMFWLSCHELTCSIFVDNVFLDVVRDDPTNNVPDTVFSKLGMQLHRRDQHPIGILKNAIYEYFDTSYSNKFDKFDNLCPIVTVKQVWT